MALICYHVVQEWEDVVEVESVLSSDGLDGDSALSSDESDGHSAVPSEESNGESVVYSDESDGESVVYSDDSAYYSSGSSDDGDSLITPADSIADLEMPTLDDLWDDSEDGGEVAQEISLDCIADDMKQLRPFVRYTVNKPADSEDDSDPHVDELQDKIVFEDGRSWYVMLRPADLLPDFVSLLTATIPEAMKPTHPRVGVESEFLTMKALKKAGVDLIPNAYLPKKEGVMWPGIESAHFYMDVMPGTQCPATIFPPPFYLHYPNVPADPVSSRILLKAFIESYADHQIQLSKLRFETMCQLEYSDDGEVVEGPILEDSHPLPDRRRKGPFTSLGAFHIARIENLIYGLRHRNEVWSPEERNEYITLLECLKWIRKSKWLMKDRYEFYLRHEQDYLGNYLVTNGKLSGVLEWQGAYSTIKEEAFGSPRFMRSQQISIRATLDAPLSDAEELLSEAYIARGRDDLAGCVVGAKKYRALWQIPESMADIQRLKELLEVEDDVPLPTRRNQWLLKLVMVDYREDIGMLEDYERSRAPSPRW